MTDPSTQKWLRQNVQPYVASDIVYTHLDAVLAAFPTLKPKSDVYTFDDGRSQLLLCLHGLLPITYRHASYNTPLNVWLTRDYPRQPPVVYVVPTSEMLVRSGRHLDVSGRCNHDYLRHWERKDEGRTLLGLLHDLQDHFSREPPVYAKPKQPNPVQGSQPAQTRSPPPVPQRPFQGSVSSAPLSPPRPPPPPPPQIHHAESGFRHTFQPPIVAAPVPQRDYSTAPPPPPPPPLPPQLADQARRNLSYGLVPSPAHLPLADAVPGFSDANNTFSLYRPPPVSNPPHAYRGHSISPISNNLTQPVPAPPPLHPIPPNPIEQQIFSGIRTNPIPNLLDDDIEPTHPPSQGVFQSIPQSAPPRPPNPELLELHRQVHHKLTSEVNSLAQVLALDAERLRAHQNDLLTGEPAIRDEMARLEAVRDVCRGVADRTRDAVQRTESNIAELRRKGDPEVDELVCATSIVHNQLINLVAEDNAIEDTIYHLHRALNCGRIDLERFLRSTRVLAEEQFTKRALINKILGGMSSLSPNLRAGWS